LFSFGEIIQKSLESVGRIEEAKLVSKDLFERKKNTSKIVDKFSRKDPEKVLNNLRLYSERFWVDYLGRTTFQKLHSDSKSELIESMVSEELIKKNILTNASQIALSFCKVIERELNISLFDPFLLEYQKCSINPIPKKISKTQKRKIESRKLTIQTCKSCANKEHRLTFGQIIFLLRFWDDKIMNESSNLFHLIGGKIGDFSELTKSVNELLDYLELKNGKLTLVDIRNSSAHPTIDDSINWDENIEWIKKLLGEPPKEILKRIVNNLREY